MSLPIPSLDPFIALCDQARPLFMQLGEATIPPLFPLQFDRKSVTAHLAAERIRSLKDLAETLKTLQPIAPLFQDVDTSLSAHAPPVEEATAVLVSPRSEYDAIITVLREWRGKDKKPASERMHNNHYHLPNISDEFHCLAEAADKLGEVIAAGTALIHNSTLGAERRRFATNLRCVLKLHRDELGKIYSRSAQGGVEFGRHKCRLYMLTYPRLASLSTNYLSSTSGLLSTVGQAGTNLLATHRSVIKQYLADCTKLVPPDADTAQHNTRLAKLGKRVDACKDVSLMSAASQMANGAAAHATLRSIEEVFQ